MPITPSVKKTESSPRNNQRVLRRMAESIRRITLR